MSDFNAITTEEKVHYPFSPEVVVKELGLDKEINVSSSVGPTNSQIITLDNEGNGIFSLEKGNEAISKELVDAGHNSVDPTRQTFGQKEEGVASSVQKKGGSERECLSKETFTGHS